MILNKANIKREESLEEVITALKEMKSIFLFFFYEKHSNIDLILFIIHEKLFFYFDKISQVFV